MGTISIAVNGSSGRMGKEIISALKSHPRAEFLCGIDRSTEGSIKKLDKLKFKKKLVVIDFSSPVGFNQSLNWCVKNKCAFVSGTTGLKKKDFTFLKVASKKIPVLWSPNMSVGINLFLKIISDLGPALKDYDLQVEDIHHNEKKDSPSGTAILLQNAIETQIGKKAPKVLSARLGGVIGIHKLWISDKRETITIEHSATERSVFATGAVQAALWISKKHKGYFTMKDVISER